MEPTHELTEDYLNENPETANELAEQGLDAGAMLTLTPEGEWFVSRTGDPINPPKPPPPTLP